MTVLAQVDRSLRQAPCVALQRVAVAVRLVAQRAMKHSVGGSAAAHRGVGSVESILNCIVLCQCPSAFSAQQQLSYEGILQVLWVDRQVKHVSSPLLVKVMLLGFTAQ